MVPVGPKMGLGCVDPLYSAEGAKCRRRSARLFRDTVAALGNARCVMALTESTVEDAALAWFGELGYAISDVMRSTWFGTGIGPQLPSTTTAVDES